MNNWHDARRQATHTSYHKLVKLTFIPQPLKLKPFVCIEVYVLICLLRSLSSWFVHLVLRGGGYSIFGPSICTAWEDATIILFSELHETDHTSTKILFLEYVRLAHTNHSRSLKFSICAMRFFHIVLAGQSWIYVIC